MSNHRFNFKPRTSAPQHRPYNCIFLVRFVNLHEVSKTHCSIILFEQLLAATNYPLPNIFVYLYPDCLPVRALNLKELSLIALSQALSSGESAEESLVACRTRSKHPLTDVPLDQLEAELKAPDITPDMYDCASALEDKEWSHWLQGLMTSHLDNEGQIYNKGFTLFN